MSGLEASSQAVDVSSTSIVALVPPLPVMLRVVVPVIDPHHSTVSQLPRVYLYWISGPPRPVIVASQMPPPLSVMRSFPGPRGRRWPMLPGRETAPPGGIPAGTRTRKVTATGRGWMLSSAGRDDREPSGLRYVALATISALDAVPAGVTVKLTWKPAPAASLLLVVGDVGTTVQPAGAGMATERSRTAFGPWLVTVATTRPGEPAVRPSGASSVNVTAGSGRRVSGRPSCRTTTRRPRATLRTGTDSVWAAAS